MSITHLTSVSQLNGILASSKNKLSVIDFHATWCGPCHAIAPVFEKLAKEYTNVNFLKCDVDAAREVASLYAVTAMPTFVFLSGTTKVDQVRGANRTALEDAIRRHSSGSTASASGQAFTGKGHTLSESADRDAGIITTGNNGLLDINPQTKILLGLIGIYIVFWYLSA